MWIIKDWANNVMFDGKEFNYEVEADEYLDEQLEKLYPECENNQAYYNEVRGEYHVVLK